MKTFILLILGMTCISLGGVCQTFAPLLYYNFEGTLEDHSGNNFHGVGTSILFETGPGTLNVTSASFNGENSFIELPSAPELNLDVPFSYSFWLWLDEYSPGILTLDFIEDQHSGSWIALTPDDWKIALCTGDGGDCAPDSRIALISDVELELNTWYHVLGIVRDYDDMSLYIDCTEVDAQYDGEGNYLFWGQSAPGSLGRKDGSVWQDPYYFKGRLDEFRIWDRELLPVEIGFLCNRDLDFENELGIIESATSLRSTVWIFDVQGRLVLGPLTGLGDSLQDVTSSLESGIYVTVISNGKTIKTQRFFIP